MEQHKNTNISNKQTKNKNKSMNSEVFHFNFDKN